MPCVDTYHAHLGTGHVTQNNARSWVGAQARATPPIHPFSEQTAQRPPGQNRGSGATGEQWQLAPHFCSMSPRPPLIPKPQIAGGPVLAWSSSLADKGHWAGFLLHRATGPRPGTGGYGLGQPHPLLRPMATSALHSLPGGKPGLQLLPDTPIPPPHSPLILISHSRLKLPHRHTAPLCHQAPVQH